MNEFLPVGSVITKKKDIEKNKKYIILGYFPIIEEKTQIFDYLCFPYPEGIKENNKSFVNEDEIEDVYFIGFQTKLNEKMLPFFKEQSTILKHSTNIEKTAIEMILKFNERNGWK